MDNLETKKRVARRTQEYLWAKQKLLPVKMSEWAYLAGLFDADGCFSARLKQTWVMNRLSFVNTSRTVIDWIMARIPFAKCSLCTQKATHHKRYWRVSVNRRTHIMPVVERLLPFLVIKQERARLLLAICRARGIQRTKSEESIRDLARIITKHNERGLRVA